MAAKLLAAVHQKPDIDVQAGPDAAAKIDSWLAVRVAKDDGDFESDLKLAAAAGSTASVASEVARYLLHRSDRGFGFDHWECLEKEEAWYLSLRSDPGTQLLVERFIREVLPWTHGWYGTDFALDLKRLVADLSAAFLDAAKQIVGLGVIHSDDAIAEGALDDLPGGEAIVDEALLTLTPKGEDLERQQQIHLAVLNGEYSEEYADHLVNDDEDGYTAGEFLKRYVGRVRATVGWEYLVHHKHRDRLIAYWLRNLRERGEDARPELEEVDGVFGCAYNTDDEADLWYLILLAWSEHHMPALISRMTAGSASRKIRLAALTCLIEHAPAKLRELGSELSAQGKTFRLFEIALDLAHLAHARAGDWKDHEPAATAALPLLPTPFPDLTDAYLQILKGQVPTVSEVIYQLVVGITEKTEDVRRLRAALDPAASLTWQEDVRWLLANAEEPNIAVEALRAASRKGMQDEVNASLKHKFAAVRAEALDAIGKSLAAPLPRALLGMANDKGSPVRKALITLLDAKLHPAHIPTLLELARDQYSERSPYYDESSILPIARKAVAALKRHAPPLADAAESLYGIAIDTDDGDLRSDIFELLATTGDTASQKLLFELAIKPGRPSVRRDAASALLQSNGVIAPEIVARITPELLVTRIGNVAARLALLLASEGEVRTVQSVAEQLAANPKRRVFILLLIRQIRCRDTELAEAMAEMLPDGHPALAWALGAEIDWANDQLLSDLGDPDICSEVFVFMRPQRS
jgi:hypothetical protein